MALETGRIYLAKRIGYRDGKPLFKISVKCPTYGNFDAESVVYAKRIGFRDGKPLLKIVSGECDENGDLIVGNVYPAKRIGFRDGKPLFKVECKTCDGIELVILCDLEFTPTGTIQTVALDGTGSPGIDPMFDSWTGLALQTGQILLSDISFDHYDFSLVYLNTSFGAPPFFTHGANYQQPTVFGVCSSNVTAETEAYGYQTPWTAFNSGSLQFKHVYLVSKVTRTVITPPTTFESCAYNFWTFVREAEGEPTTAWYYGYTNGINQNNTWCDSGNARQSSVAPQDQGTACYAGASGLAFGFSVNKPESGGVDVGPCMNWAVGP